MNPVDALPVIAEIALGLVGLTAIVTVLRQPDGGLVGADLVRSLHLLAYSSATLLLALLPSLLTAMGTDADATWRVASGGMALCSLPGFAFAQARPRFSLGRLRASILLALWVFGALNLALQIANATGLFGAPRLWPFLLGLMWYLLFCLTQFASLLFLRPHG